MSLFPLLVGPHQDAAVKELEATREEAQKISRTYGLSIEVQEQANELKQEAEDLRDEGMSSSKRKSYRASSWQTRSQQKSR